MPALPVPPVNQYISSPRVQACMEKLRVAFGDDRSRFVVSDVLDAQGNQYVNLVQKGGGVLGVALIGYTYILEHMGVRFLRMAGTSAGAINTAMLGIIGNKHEEKSIRVLDAVTKLDFFSLVDGHPFARWLIRNLVRHNGFMKKLKTIALWVLISCLALFFINFILLLFVPKNPVLLAVSIGIYVVTLILIIVIGITAWYIRKMARRLKDSGYGINPGDTFYDWIKGQMTANGVLTVHDLEQKASQPVPGIHLREEHPLGVSGLVGDVTFIASELVTQNKIEFPKMQHLFWSEGQQGLEPAGFVRASMSIPLFFESYFIENIPCTREEIKRRWLETFNEDDPPSVARFVDGGILSNFPISIFYNPQVVVPRLPTFGIDLDDSYVSDKRKHASEWSFQGYFGRIFNTIRNYYDKDFQLKNRVYSRGIGTVYLHEFNWLNFFLTDIEKLTMFEKGAEAATEFLLHFDWKAYKEERTFLQQVLEK